MTPAKALALLDKRMGDLELKEHPIAQLACMFWNAKFRNTGDSANGIPADEAKHPDEFRLFRRKATKTLAAKDRPGGRHNLDGAHANKSDWFSWAEGKQEQKPRIRK